MAATAGSWGLFFASWALALGAVIAWCALWSWVLTALGKLWAAVSAREER